MNAAERDQLQQFLSALRQNRAVPKDPVADALIREALASQPDATYWLVQRAMGLASALEAAHSRIRQLEATSPQQTVVPEVGASTWGRGVMAQAASTAAGVVAGGLLFQGVQSLMGHGGDGPVPAGGASSLVSASDAGDASWGESEDWA